MTKRRIVGDVPGTQPSVLAVRRRAATGATRRSRGLALLAGAWLAAGVAGCAGQPPELGLDANGTLMPCPSTPNCVSSDARQDAEHFIAPLALAGDGDAAWRVLNDTLAAQAGVTIVNSSEFYLRTEWRTRLLRFVDDVEFHLRPEDQVIAMRSASRVGYSDLGTNRRRLETVRETLANAGVLAATK